MKEKKNKRVDDVSLVESYSEDDDKKKKGCGASSMKSCQADKCSVDLSDAKPYHRRHKVCELHAKANLVLLAGTRQRFCQQCSRFHALSEFDEIKRSCRRRLAGHNERRRKNPTDNSQADGSNGAKSVKDNSNSIAPSTS